MNSLVRVLLKHGILLTQLASHDGEDLALERPLHDLGRGNGEGLADDLPVRALRGVLDAATLPDLRGTLHEDLSLGGDLGVAGHVGLADVFPHRVLVHDDAQVGRVPHQPLLVGRQDVVPGVEGLGVRVHLAPQGDPLARHAGSIFRPGQEHRGIWKKKKVGIIKLINCVTVAACFRLHKECSALFCIW